MSKDTGRRASTGRKVLGLVIISACSHCFSGCDVVVGSVVDDGEGGGGGGGEVGGKGAVSLLSLLSTDSPSPFVSVSVSSSSSSPCSWPNSLVWDGSYSGSPSIDLVCFRFDRSTSDWTSVDRSSSVWSAFDGSAPDSLSAFRSGRVGCKLTGRAWLSEGHSSFRMVGRKVSFSGRIEKWSTYNDNKN